MQVITTHEEKRGCGYRKPSKSGVGIYLVGPAFDAPCGRMPFELKACPTCGGGIKPSRGWNWITPSELFKRPEGTGRCGAYEGEDSASIRWLDVCVSCPLGGAIPEGKHGLIWIGEGHYPTPEDFLMEAKRMGLSRKIGALPKGFELGKTVVYLAHRKAFRESPVRMKDGTLNYDAERFLPGIFATFKPTGVDLVIADADAVPEKAEKLAEKIGDGARIVKVIPKGEQVSLPIVQEGATP